MLAERDALLEFKEFKCGKSIQMAIGGSPAFSSWESFLRAVFDGVPINSEPSLTREGRSAGSATFEVLDGYLCSRSCGEA
jgi:hypothetical protein